MSGVIQFNKDMCGETDLAKFEKSEILAILNLLSLTSELHLLLLKSMLNSGCS